MPMVSLGEKIGGETVATSSSEREFFPSIHLSGDAAVSLTKGMELRDEREMKVKVRLVSVSMREDEDGVDQTATFDVLEMGEASETKGDESRASKIFPDQK